VMAALIWPPIGLVVPKSVLSGPSPCHVGLESKGAVFCGSYVRDIDLALPVVSSNYYIDGGSSSSLPIWRECNHKRVANFQTSFFHPPPHF